MLYVIYEFSFISLSLFWHVKWNYFVNEYMLNFLTWLLYIISSYFTTLLFILDLIVCSMRLTYDIVFIISFIKLILLVLWKHFICHQGTLPLSLMYLFHGHLCLVFIYSHDYYFLSGMHVVCIIGHFPCYTCWTNPIILWKYLELQLKYVPFLFLYS